MNFEILKWAQDLGAYIEQGRKRFQLRQTQHGIDYSAGEYRDAVRKVVSRIHPRMMDLRITNVIEETPTTKTFRFERIDGKLPPFRAGQYVNLHVKLSRVSTSRSYSISSPPGEDHIDLTVRLKPGGFVSPYLLEEAKAGDVFESSGPAGQFYYEPLIDLGELVFIAGGSGITPFMSMLRNFAKQGWPVKVNLIYGSRSLDDVIFAGELDRLSRNNKNLNYALALSEPSEEYKGVTGFITDHLIKSHVGGLSGKTFMICGPNAMYDFVMEQFQALKVPPYKIRRELQGPPDDITMAPGWPVKVKADHDFTVEVVGKKVIVAKAGEPLLNSLERNGLAVPALCRSGECSYCRMKLLSGNVFVPSHAGLRESDRLNGYIHSCTSYPVEDLTVAF